MRSLIIPNIHKFVKMLKNYNLMGDSPYFFMREMSDDKMVEMLQNKILQYKECKNIADQINKELLYSIVKLEKTKKEIAHHTEKLELEVKEKAKELLKSERLSAIGELSTRIAHDLLNPLNVIKTSSEILKKYSGTLSENSINKKWQMHERAINRMEHQIKDVLNFIRKSPIVKKDSSLSKILKESIEQITIPSNVSINTPKEETFIHCDPIKFQVVFVNLILNAIQAMNKNKGTIEISISKNSINNSLLIKVKDTGPGIPKNIIKKIFDPLFTTKQIGTGLGLPSCKNILEQHEGSIQVSSEIGVGTTYSLRIPQKNHNIEKHNLKIYF